MSNIAQNKVFSVNIDFDIRVLLLCFDFFLHVDILPVGIVELVLKESQFLRGDDPYAQSVLHLPLHLEAE